MTRALAAPGVESLSVVADLQHYRRALTGQPQMGIGSAGVAPHVAERLTGDLDDFPGLGGELGRDRHVDVDRDLDPVLRREVFGNVAKRLVKVAVGKNPRAKAKNVIAKVPDSPVDL